MAETEGSAVLDAEDLLIFGLGAGSSQSPSATSAAADSTHVSDSHSFVSTSAVPSEPAASSSSRKKRKRKVNRGKAAKNAKKKSKATSERDLPTGVYKTPSGKFRSTIHCIKERNIGTFATPEQASAAYTSVKKNLDDAKLSAVGPDEVNVIFEASKTKASEVYGGIKSSFKRKGTGFIDLAGVPPQPPILKNQLGHTLYSDNSRRRPTKEGSSKYTGIHFDAAQSKWKAQIMVEGKNRTIGYYDNEEDAAADYARAAYKYKKRKENSNVYGGLNLSGAPGSLPLIRSERAATGFVGVKRKKGRYRRYQACIGQQKKSLTLGTFDTPEEAALVYARARWYLESNPQGKEEGTSVSSGLVEEPSGSYTGLVAGSEVTMGGKGGNGGKDGRDVDHDHLDNAHDEDPVDRSYMSDIDSSEVDGVAV